MNILFISGGMTFGKSVYKYGLSFGNKVFKALDVDRNKITVIYLANHSREKTELSQLLGNSCVKIISMQKKPCSRMSHRINRIWCFIMNTPVQYRQSYSLEMKNKIRDMDKQDLFDVVIYDGYNVAQYADCIKKLPKILFLGDSVVLGSQEMLKSSVLRIFDRLELLRHLDITKNAERHNYTDFERCIVFTEKDKDIIFQLSPALNIDVLPYCVDTQYFRKKTLEDKNIIIFKGIMWTEHNADAVYYLCKDIFPLIRKKNRDIVLLLIGGIVRKELRNLVQGNSNIKLVDFVEDTRPYLDRATVFVSPMRIGSGMNNKVLEAMSMSKAIVTTEFGNRGINLKDGLEGIVCRDKYKFADAVIELLEDKEKREMLGRNARIKAEKEFSIKVFSDRLNAIIVSVKNSHRHA